MFEQKSDVTRSEFPSSDAAALREEGVGKGDPGVGTGKQRWGVVPAPPPPPPRPPAAQFVVTRLPEQETKHSGTGSPDPGLEQGSRCQRTAGRDAPGPPRAGGAGGQFGAAWSFTPTPHHALMLTPPSEGGRDSGSRREGHTAVLRTAQ